MMKSLFLLERLCRLNCNNLHGKYSRKSKSVYNVYIQYCRRGTCMQIIISNQSREPIYEQIAAQIKKQILINELQAGQPLPSMRQLAKDLGISVITTKRAYEELEKNGYIYSVVGKGSFVSEQNKEMIFERKMSVIEEQLRSAVKNSKEIGIELAHLEELLRMLYKEEA